MFAYCGNNPISREDGGGSFWHLVVGAVVGAVTQYVSDVVSSRVEGKSITESLIPTSSIIDYMAAAASGALSASGVGRLGSAIANATIDGIAYVANCKNEGKSVNADVFLATVATSAITAGKGINGAKLRGTYKYSTEVLKSAVSEKKIAIYTAKQTDILDTVFGEIRSSLHGGFKEGLIGGIRKRVEN